MAKTKCRRKSSNPSHKRAGSARRRKSNPAGRHHHHHRRNPGMGGNIKQWLYGGVGVLGGVIGTRTIPQLVLGSGNSGPIGYAANIASAALLTFAAHFVSKDKVFAAAVAAGGVASIISRAIQDFGLLGPYSAQAGLGDYLVSDFLTPQRLTNGLQNANLRIPGWGGASAPAAVPVNVSGAGVGDLYGGALY
jgi:hypothetical protein